MPFSRQLLGLSLAAHNRLQLIERDGSTILRTNKTAHQDNLLSPSDGEGDSI
jgi:hypothetical protein